MRKKGQNVKSAKSAKIANCAKSVKSAGNVNIEERRQ